MAEPTDKAKEAAGTLGGLSGVAARLLGGRGKQIDEATDKATGGGSPNQNDSKGADGNGRPGYRRKWSE